MKDRWNLRGPEGKCKLCLSPAEHVAGCGGALLEQIKLRATFTVPDDDIGPVELFEEGRDERSLGASLGVSLQTYRATGSPPSAPELSLQLNSVEPQALARFNLREIDRATETAEKLAAAAAQEGRRVWEDQVEYDREHAAKEHGRRAGLHRLNDEIEALRKALRVSGLPAEVLVALDAKRVELAKEADLLRFPTPHTRKPFEERTRGIKARLAASLEALKKG